MLKSMAEWEGVLFHIFLESVREVRHFYFHQKTFGQARKSEIQMGNSSGRGSQAGREVIFAQDKKTSKLSAIQETQKDGFY